MTPARSFDRRPLLLGVVHLDPLPGSVAWSRARREGPGPSWRRHAVDDARALLDAGFDGVIVENFSDAPFFARTVPPETVAAMAIATRAVREAVGRTSLVGVNVLRNDVIAALAIAAAADADLVRANVLGGAVVTDQGLVEGDAARALRERERLCPDVRVLADVRVKHAAPLAPRPIEEEARDLAARGGADALVVTGTRTGAPVSEGTLETVRRAVPEVPLLVGSGSTAENIGRLLLLADGVIVGTAVKRGGRVSARVDGRRASSFVRAARGRR